MDAEERQATVAAIVFGVFGVAIPVLSLAGSLFVAGWADALNAHDPHGIGFGWVSHHAKNGDYTVGRFPLFWYLGIFTVWAVYEVCELIALLISVLSEQMTS